MHSINISESGDNVSFTTAYCNIILKEYQEGLELTKNFFETAPAVHRNVIQPVLSDHSPCFIFASQKVFPIMMSKDYFFSHRPSLVNK